MPDASPASSIGTVCMVIFLDDTIEIDDPEIDGGQGGGMVMCEPAGDSAFGFHWSFTTNSGNTMYYAVIGALDDNCLAESCPDPSTCSLQTSQAQLDRLTQVASHEVAEMMTDPQFPTGWAPEIGDTCNGISDTITVGADTWTVQQIYSVETDLADEAICQTSAPEPLPPQAGGPGSATAMSQSRPGHLDRILPLPTVRFDHENKTIEFSERDTRRFVNRVTIPVTVGELPAHFPKLLRDAADHLDNRAGRRVQQPKRRTKKP